MELEKKIGEIRLKNKTDEDKLRADFKKADSNYQESINIYDADMKEHTRDRE